MRNFKFDGNAMRLNVYVASASQTTQPTLLRHQLLLAIFVSIFICFSGAAQAQSRQDVGAAEAVIQGEVRSAVDGQIEQNDCIRKRIDFDKSIINLTKGPPSTSGVEYIRKFHPEADLVKYPPAKYSIDTAHVGYLLVGE